MYYMNTITINYSREIVPPDFWLDIVGELFHQWCSSCSCM